MERCVCESDGKRNMKPLTFLLIILSVLIAACGPQATPLRSTATPVPPTPAPPTSTAVPPADLTPAQVAALSALSESLGLPLAQIKIVQTEAVEWRDSCLDVDLPGLACLQVITSGFRIRLEANGLQYEYHTDQDGKSVRAATVALTWHREGGIAGFCDDMQVYLSGEVFGSSCGGEYRLGKLTADEIQELREWVTTFGNVAVESKDQAVADAMSLGLILNGLGTAQPTDADKTAMFNWVQVVYDQAAPCC